MIPVDEPWQVLKLLPVRFVLRAQTALHLPRYKGSTLRGGFGAVFKDTVCVVEHRDCQRCLLRSRCAYPYVFDTPVPEGATRMRKYVAAPHPFVLLPPLEAKTRYAPGETLSFDCTLIGRGADYLPYFIYAFERLGAQHGLGKGRGRFAVETVAWLAPGGQEVVIYRGEDQTLRSGYRALEARELVAPGVLATSSLLTLRFLTPARLVYGGALTDRLDFHVLVRALLRRLANLAYFHCGAALELDFRGLIAQASEVETVAQRLRWYDWERYSARQDTRMKLGGVIGKVTYRGPWQPFLPLLQLGTFVHVGKGSSFGLGKYVLEHDGVRHEA
ncbi:MAG: CRISPR-associated protein Cas6 [Candidatus Tectimicrobiota bacterium]|nr:MAG: CRISPR-associated protein Cas6 [Candidatus Tectomicrobia bacterium]